MQPTSRVPALLAPQAASDGLPKPEPMPLGSVQRIEERPQSALAQGSYAWPAWVVIAIAVSAAVGALAWWLRLRRRGGAGAERVTSAARAKGHRP